MTTAETLSQLWEELAAPSSTAFLKALRARGISAREADVREFVSSKSERQIIQTGVKSTGKIVAHYPDDRWAADVINYTSRPAERNKEKFAHALIVQDMFSRYLWTAEMSSVSDTTATFTKILESTGRKPRMLTTDKGPEFVANSFKEVCDRYTIEVQFKDAQDMTAISRLDNAIAQVKKSTRRLQSIKGGDWLTHLDHATKAYNKTIHGAIDAAPNDLPDSVILEQSKAAAQAAEHNMQDIKRRKTKLEQMGDLGYWRIRREDSKGESTHRNGVVACMS
jgi:transposase InsO family protein